MDSRIQGCPLTSACLLEREQPVEDWAVRGLPHVKTFELQSKLLVVVWRNRGEEIYILMRVKQAQFGLYGFMGSVHLLQRARMQKATSRRTSATR